MIVEQRDRQRRFYPGGDLIDYFQPKYRDGLYIQWNTVTDRASLLSLLSGRSDDDDDDDGCGCNPNGNLRELQ